MKKIFFYLFFLLIFNQCSFDNKTGVWKNEEEIILSTQKKNTEDLKWENVFDEESSFSDEKEPRVGFSIEDKNPFKNKAWLQEYFNESNNIPNLYYSNKKNIIYKSSKLSSRNRILEDNKFLYFENNIISTDTKGNIFSYSLDFKSNEWQYNFYKKTYKKYKKNLDFIVNKNQIFIADNLGYMYSLNLKNGSLIWAKNFGIPFRSNMKMLDGQIFLADQDNLIYSINPNNGETNWKYSTSSSALKSKFKNNFSFDLKNESIFFLNTNGELYSINYNIPKINWIISLNEQSIDENTNLFVGHPITLNNENIIISTKNDLLNFNKLTGSKLWQMPVSSKIKPIAYNKYVFLISNDDLLICLDSSTGKIIWSKYIFQLIKKSKISFNKIKGFYILNNQINLITTNGYLLVFDYNNGSLLSADLIIKSNILVDPIIVDGFMYILDVKNKITKLN